MLNQVKAILSKRSKNLVTANAEGLSTESIFQAARQLPREGRIVLIELLAVSLREDESIDPEVLAAAERRWTEIESGVVQSSSLADLDLELRTKYQWR